MSASNAVTIREVGPREGFQIEKAVFSTDEKARLIEALATTGLTEIQVCSFVRPDKVPQMADAETLVSTLRVFPDVRYSAVYLNQKGLERALRAKNLHVDGRLSLSASETFSKNNINQSHADRLAAQHDRAALLAKLDFKSVELGVSAAFGCNFEGDISFSRVMDRFSELEEIAVEHGLMVSRLELLDTMGWANPTQIRRSVEALAAKWPDIPIALHLHDTRGLGIANAYAGLEMGVREFDASIGGLGGCPFSGHGGAAGNVATEELVFLCHELGFETGIDLDALLGAVDLAEEIVGRPLPGRLKRGGKLKHGSNGREGRS